MIQWIRTAGTAALWAVVLLYASSVPCFAATPGKIKYQGVLRENGVAVTGPRTVSFALFTQATGGTAVWESGDIAVNVANGLFTCELTPDGGIDWSAGSYYLQVTVNGTVMVPREGITSTVYALQARSVDDGAIGTSKVGDGAITSAKLAAGSVTDEKVVSVSWSKITGVPASTVSTETVAGMQAEIAALKVSTGVLATDVAAQQANISGVQAEIAALKVSTGALAGQVAGKYDKAGGVLTGNLDATGYRITASTIGSPGTKLYGDGSGLTGLPGGADNLGNHTATQNLNLAGNAVVNVSSIAVGAAAPEFKLTLDNDGGILAKGDFGSGSVLTSTGAGTRLIWYPRKAAFRAGYVHGTQWDNVNVGDYSTAFGVGTTASGDYSTAFGVGTTASGVLSAAFGWGTTASGDDSTAFGWGTIASGGYSAAFGYNTTAYGFVSVAMGWGFTNPHPYTLGIGYDGVSGSTTTPDILLNPLGNSWLNAGGGYVLVRTTVPFTGRTEVLQLNGSGYASAWNTPSDQRLKKNIATISGALDRVLKLRGVTYEWKDPERHGGESGRQMGFIAQEAKEVIPEVVSGGDAGEYAVAYGPVVALLVEAIKKQAAQNQRLEQRNRELEERLRVVEQKLGSR